MSLKKLFIFLIGLCILASSFAGAAVNGRSSEDMMKLFDEYLFHVKLQQQGPDFLEYGRQKFLSRGVIAQASTLEPEDFNRFMFSLMNRYVTVPSERRYIFNFFSAITETLQADFAYTRALQAGPQSFMLEGTYKYGGWLMIAGGVVLKVASRRPVFARAGEWIGQREAALSQINRYYGLGFRYATSPTTWLITGSLGAGALAGYVEHGWAMDKVHRHNPIAAAMVVQAQLVCHLSYEGLGLEQRVKELADKPDDLAKEAPAIRKTIKDITAQAKELSSQWRRLEDLQDLVADKFFKEMQAQYPKAENWQQLVKALKDNEVSRDGKCRGLSTIHLIRTLNKTLGELPPEPQPELPTQPAPPTPSEPSEPSEPTVPEAR